MADQWKPVVFNEGEPLDPNKLNQLQTNITGTYAQTNTLLTNATTNGQTQQYKHVFNCGQIQFTDLVKDTPKAMPLDLGTGFESTPAPIVTATVRTSLKKGENVITYVTSSGNANWQVWVISNVAKNINVDWIAVQKLAV